MNSPIISSWRAGQFVFWGLCAMASSLQAVGQGTILFYNHVNGELVTHVYLGGDQQFEGNGANDTPSGTQDWSAFTAVAGSGYTAQLWAADGPNQPESSLQPVVPTTTFLAVTGAAGALVNAGWVQVPGVPVGDSATITLRVWDNRGGTVTSWGMAQAEGVALGQSPLFTSLPLTGVGAPGPLLAGLVSFNIYQVPEPSMLALSSLGLAALWLVRRRK